MLREIDQMSPDDGRWQDKVTEVQSSLPDHIQREEHEIVPRISTSVERESAGTGGHPDAGDEIAEDAARLIS